MYDPNLPAAIDALLDPVSRAYIVNARYSGAAAAPKMEFRRIWQIHDFLVCPVIGTCLTLAEQKHILKKTGDASKNADSYDVHTRMVHLCATENKTSLRVDALLNRKYAEHLRRLAQS